MNATHTPEGEFQTPDRGRAHVVERILEEGLALLGGGVGPRAEAARDALSASLAGGKHPPATVVGAYSPASGKVTAGASRGTGKGSCRCTPDLGCAGGVCAEALENAADIQFATAVCSPPPEPGRPVCENCETTFGRDAFPDPDTLFKTDQ